MELPETPVENQRTKAAQPIEGQETSLKTAPAVIKAG
jgi:hypothetical protein